MAKRIITSICLIFCIGISCTGLDISHSFVIKKDGLYLLNENFELALLYPGSTYYCKRFDSILFFNLKLGGGSILYDLQTGFTTKTTASHIVSVKYISGSSISILYEYDIIGKSEEAISIVEIEKNSNPELILDKNIDGQYIDYFFLGDAYRTDDVISGEYSGNGDDIYILEMYDTFIKFDLSKIEKKYDYSNIEIYYIEDKNFFFISADNYGRLE